MIHDRDVNGLITNSSTSIYTKFHMDVVEELASMIDSGIKVVIYPGSYAMDGILIDFDILADYCSSLESHPLEKYVTEREIQNGAHTWTHMELENFPTDKLPSEEEVDFIHNYIANSQEGYEYDLDTVVAVYKDGKLDENLTRLFNTLSESYEGYS